MGKNREGPVPNAVREERWHFGDEDARVGQRGGELVGSAGVGEREWEYVDVQHRLRLGRLGMCLLSNRRGHGCALVLLELYALLFA